MKNDRRKKFISAVKQVAETTGRKPETIVEDLLRKILMKTPIDALQKIGLVTGEPKDKDIDLEATKRQVAEEIAREFSFELFDERMRKVASMFDTVLEYRQARGLGAEFSYPYSWGNKDIRKFLLQLLALRKSLAKAARKGRDENKRIVGILRSTDSLAKALLEKTDAAIAALDGKSYKLRAADVKAFEAKQRAEAEKIARKAARQQAFDRLTLRQYHTLCFSVLADELFDDDEKLVFAPYPLLTRQDVVRLLVERFKKIARLETDMNGPRQKGFPKSFYKECMADVRRELKEYPADLVKEAKAQFEMG